MTEKLNPYKSPQTTHEVQSDKRADVRVTVLDWAFAFFLGALAFFLTVFAVCFGFVISLMASDAERLFSRQFEIGLVSIGMPLCLLFALCVGYSGGTNFLANRIRRARARREAEGNAIQLEPSRLDTVLRKTVTLDKLLTGCSSGLVSVLLSVPLACFLVGWLSETLRLSPEQTYVALLTGFIGSIVAGLLIGWYRWRRVSAR